MKIHLLPVLFVIFSLCAYSQTLPVPSREIVKKNTINIADEAYNLYYWKSNLATIMNKNFRLPDIKQDDRIYFFDQMRLIPEIENIKDITVNTINKGNNKLFFQNISTHDFINFTFYVDNKTYKVLYIKFTYDPTKITDVSFFYDLEKAFKNYPGYIIKPIKGSIPEHIKSYGYYVTGLGLPLSRIKNRISQ